VSVSAWLILSAVVVLGSVVQGTTGFGLNVLVAPVAALLNPDLVPVPLILTAVVHTTLLAWSERRNLRIGEVGWVLVGRIPGVVIGVWVLSVVSQESIQVVFGVILLLVIGISMYRRGIPRTPFTLSVAGTIAGITGSTVSVGGPPVALVLANDTSRLRSNLATLQALSTIMTIAGLWVGGHIARSDIWVSIRLMPALLLGFALSRPLIGHLDRGRTITAVYSISAIAAVALLIKGLV
jgi:uncharacterized membrane protein YfcA